MSTIPAGTKFHGVATGVDTVNKGSANANANRDAYTIEALASAINILIENNEVVRLVPLFVNATPGGSATLTEDVNIVDFDWSVVRERLCIRYQVQRLYLTERFGL